MLLARASNRFGTGKGKRFYVVRGPGEDRSDEEIFAEANTEVIVPVFRPGS